ncbi:hypothetical protein LEP1GSC024_1707 [Leptospira noguchii str. 2001034031]|uniref:Uncharacterized protein n=1 Tax=Leptospira noguchii str. 2001034031 TaxID=1193053 RepID=M6Y427_9LEPT|nr:hypothetical protein LEP1GSC024_1707 [Leptospira noguchii str. 2001034031]
MLEYDRFDFYKLLFFKIVVSSHILGNRFVKFRSQLFSE